MCIRDSTYPTIAEGELSKIRSEIVNQRSLSEFSKRLDLGSYLILGKGEELNNGRNKTSTLCNLFEAVIGYMSIEIGINKTEKLEDKKSQILILCPNILKSYELVTRLKSRAFLYNSSISDKESKEIWEKVFREAATATPQKPGHA